MPVTGPVAGLVGGLVVVPFVDVDRPPAAAEVPLRRRGETPSVVRTVRALVTAAPQLRIAVACHVAVAPALDRLLRDHRCAVDLHASRAGSETALVASAVSGQRQRPPYILVHRHTADALALPLSSIVDALTDAVDAVLTAESVSETLKVLAPGGAVLETVDRSRFVRLGVTHAVRADSVAALCPPEECHTVDPRSLARRVVESRRPLRLLTSRTAPSVAPLEHAVGQRVGGLAHPDRDHVDTP